MFPLKAVAPNGSSISPIDSVSSESGQSSLHMLNTLQTDNLSILTKLIQSTPLSLGLIQRIHKLLEAQQISFDESFKYLESEIGSENNSANDDALYENGAIALICAHYMYTFSLSRSRIPLNQVRRNLSSVLNDENQFDNLYVTALILFAVIYLNCSAQLIFNSGVIQNLFRNQVWFGYEDAQFVFQKLMEYSSVNYTPELHNLNELLSGISCGVVFGESEEEGTCYALNGNLMPYHNTRYPLFFERVESTQTQRAPEEFLSEGWVLGT